MQLYPLFRPNIRFPEDVSFSLEVHGVQSVTAGLPSDAGMALRAQADQHFDGEPRARVQGQGPVVQGRVLGASAGARTDLQDG